MPTPLLSYDAAVEQVRRYIAEQLPVVSSASEQVALSASLGRVLAEPIHADRDQPPFPRATRDGFACRAADANTHTDLALVGQLRAGQVSLVILKPGQAYEIMTGAPVPAGADAVFMVEHAETSGENVRLSVQRSLEPGENIVPQGAEAHSGDRLLPAGTRITPSQIALAAQCGYSQLAVYECPRVAILATGDELVSVEATPASGLGPSQIRNSNSPMLAALVTAAGAIPVVLPTAADNPEALDAAISQALSPETNASLFLLTGGVSAGKFDLVEDALARAGARILFDGVAIQPGKPLVFGHFPRAGQPPLPFFGLPGNPISSAVTFHLFAAPILAALAGDSAQTPRFTLAGLKGPWHGKPGLTRFLPAHCDFTQNPTVRLIPWQGSGDLAAFARANCLAVIPPDATDLGEGSPVQILLT